VLACLSASALSLNFSIAHAQQSASPNLLPPIEVRPSKNPDADARRITRVPKPTPTAAPARASSDGVPVVVSPTAIVTPAGQTASSVTVVTAKDIATQQYRAAPDIFATVPGLNVVQTGGPGGQTSVFMRGTNSNHTKVLIDGIDVSDPSTPNGAFDYAHLLAADIQQLEVLRGPQSGLYGSDAIGGVISIVTQKGDGPPRATASVETGSFNTFNQSVGLGGSQDNFNYAVDVAHLHAGDVPVTPAQLLPPGQKAIGNNYDNMTYSTKLGADLNDVWTVNSVVRYTDATLRFTGDSGFPSAPNPAQSTQAVQQLFTREEAVASLLDGRIMNYFGLNFTNRRAPPIRLARRHGASARAQFHRGPGAADRSHGHGRFLGRKRQQGRFRRAAVAVRRPVLPGCEHARRFQRSVRRARDISHRPGGDRPAH
jgi:vitamin B12 transporter